MWSEHGIRYKRPPPPFDIIAPLLSRRKPLYLINADVINRRYRHPKPLCCESVQQEEGTLEN
uniref:Uncharacterized protein n=1 Tax=Anguilla anguilla TaxID=7936 RepID=A0A0E9QHK0_ANGAN